MSIAPEPALIADVLVNVFAAATAAIVSISTARTTPDGPLTNRIVFALNLVAGLFLVRALGWLTESLVLGRTASFLAVIIPLASLLVLEALQRRHTPRQIKLLFAAAPIAVLCLSLTGLASEPFISTAVLAVVAGGFAIIAALIGLRDRGSLTAAENVSLQQILIGLVFLAPLIATDFRSLFPDIPVRLGAVGALIVIVVGFAPESARLSFGTRMGSLALFAVIAALFALGNMWAVNQFDAATAIRASAVGFAGLVLASIFAEAMGARAERNRLVPAMLFAETPKDFLDRLTTHPAIVNARHLDENALVHAHHPGLTSLLQVHPVLRRSEAPWGREMGDDGVERALSILATYDGSHLLAMSSEPTRLIVVSLPATSTDPRTDGELAVAQRIGALLYSQTETA